MEFMCNRSKLFTRNKLKESTAFMSICKMLTSVVKQEKV